MQTFAACFVPIMAEQIPEEAQFQELLTEIEQSTQRQVQEMRELQGSFEHRSRLMKELESRLEEGIHRKHPSASGSCCVGAWHILKKPSWRSQDA